MWRRMIIALLGVALAGFVVARGGERFPGSFEGKWKTISRSCGSESGSYASISSRAIVFNYGGEGGNDCEQKYRIVREEADWIVLELLAGPAGSTCQEGLVRMKADGTFLGKDQIEIDEIEVRRGAEEVAHRCWYVRSAEKPKEPAGVTRH